MSGLTIVNVQAPGFATQRSVPRRTIFVGEASGNTSEYLIDFSCDASGLRLSSPLMNFTSTTCALRFASGASRRRRPIAAASTKATDALVELRTPDGGGQHGRTDWHCPVNEAPSGVCTRWVHLDNDPLDGNFGAPRHEGDTHEQDNPEEYSGRSLIHVSHVRYLLSQGFVMLSPSPSTISQMSIIA